MKKIVKINGVSSDMNWNFVVIASKVLFNVHVHDAHKTIMSG